MLLLALSSPTPVAVVMGVGYIANATLDFAPRFAGTAVDVLLSFELYCFLFLLCN